MGENKACNIQEHERFRNVMFAKHGCLACEVEKLIEEKDHLLSSIKDLTKAQDDYIQLLGDEINEMAVLAMTHGYKSTRYEEGKRNRELIATLKEELYKRIKLK